jgi:hypothetical protein
MDAMPSIEVKIVTGRVDRLEIKIFLSFHYLIKSTAFSIAI